MFGRKKKSTGSAKKRSASAGKTSARPSSKKTKSSPTSKRATTRKSPSKKTAARKPAAKKTAVKRTTAGKPAARKRTGTKTTAKQAAAKKPAARKTTGTKTTAKKAASARTTARKTAAGKKPAPKAARAAASKKRTARPPRAHGAAPSVKPPVKAYTGSLPYLFVSYAHRDMKTVFSIIRKLGGKRYRIWYDEGIEPGNEWPEIVGKAIIKCSQFVVFMSPWANKSRNVRNEVNLAFTEKRDIIVVFLEETSMTDGMKLQIGTVQHMNRFDMSEKELLAQLTKVLKSSVKG